MESAPSDDVREFLEWFTETAMFNAFIESCDQQPESPAGERKGPIPLSHRTGHEPVERPAGLYWDGSRYGCFIPTLAQFLTGKF